MYSSCGDGIDAVVQRNGGADAQKCSARLAAVAADSDRRGHAADALGGGPHVGAAFHAARRIPVRKQPD